MVLPNAKFVEILHFKAMDFDEYLDQEMANGDLAMVYQRLQDEFHTKYSQLQVLFKEERELRLVMSFYHRRNNAILDLIGEKEEGRDIDDKELTDRIDNVISMNGELADLEAVKSVVDGSYKASERMKMLLLLQEAIPELEIDDAIKVEKNPQEIELWLRRNYSNLVLGKFKPIFYKNNQLHKMEGTSDGSNGHSAPKKRKKNV